MLCLAMSENSLEKKLNILWGTVIFSLLLVGCHSPTTYDHFNSFIGKPLEDRVMQAGNPISCLELGHGKVSCTWRSSSATRTIIYNSEGLGCAWSYDGPPFLGGGLTYNHPFLYSHEGCNVCEEFDKGEEAIKTKLKRCFEKSKTDDASY